MDNEESSQYDVCFKVKPEASDETSLYRVPQRIALSAGFVSGRPVTPRFNSFENIKIKFNLNLLFKSPVFSMKTGVLMVRSLRYILIVKMLFFFLFFPPELCFGCPV